jgi:hypothetical protein
MTNHLSLFLYPCYYQAVAIFKIKNILVMWHMNVIVVTFDNIILHHVLLPICTLIYFFNFDVIAPL